jgi:hypothetical protein
MIRDLGKRGPITGVPWERQVGEGVKAFESFCMYRDMGRSRTLKQVAKETGKSLSTMWVYSQQWKWVDRCNAWDDECDTRKQNAFLREIEEMGKRHARQSIGFQSVLIKPVEAFLQRLKNDAKGTVKNFDNISTEKLFDKVIKAAQAFTDIANIERKSRGEPSEITKQDITSGGNPVRVILPMLTAQPNEDNEA